ncbi:lipoprotein [Leisingera sp. ANG-Vp]|uniref:lipoprotein n=1 Tax=Leisingera sp. ANG-Vp TaxID=1577896 RepID=UPI000A507326|nr:lipoprotein [Leisingera sp. ANG-Vp]
MRKTVFALFALAVLAACGVDGEPVQPTLNAGIGVGDSGVHAGGAVGLHKGPISVFLGF